MTFDIQPVRPDDPEIAGLIGQHFKLMRSQSPEESCHVMPVDVLVRENVSFVALYDAGEVVAIGAIRPEGDVGELKSMHTAARARGRGAGRAVLRALIGHARDAGLVRLNLETGSGPEHVAARALYQSEGFSVCPPFGDYKLDPLSVFMTRAI